MEIDVNNILPYKHYLFQRKGECPSKYRMDCTSASCNYEGFEKLRSKRADRISFYVTKNLHIWGRAPYAISVAGGKHITSIYLDETTTTDPASTSPLLGYGDMIGTNDAFIFKLRGFGFDGEGKILEGASVEVYIYEGEKANVKELLEHFKKEGEEVQEVEVQENRAN